MDSWVIFFFSIIVSLLFSFYLTSVIFVEFIESVEFVEFVVAELVELAEFDLFDSLLSVS